MESPFEVPDEDSSESLDQSVPIPVLNPVVFRWLKYILAVPSCSNPSGCTPRRKKTWRTEARMVPQGGRGGLVHPTSPPIAGPSSGSHPIPIPPPRGGLVLVSFIEVAPEILDNAPAPFGADDEGSFHADITDQLATDGWVNCQGEEFVESVEHAAEAMVEDLAEEEG